jgi:FkbM family methyltransferase
MSTPSPTWRLAALLSLLGAATGFTAAELLLRPASTEPEVPVVVPSPALLPPRDFSVDFFGLTYRGNTAELIDRTVLRRGAFEKHVLYFMADVLHALARPDAVYVDVGANTGQHVLFMAPRVAQVHAFEPYPPVLERLRAHVVDNGLRNVLVHPVGLGAGPAELTFHAPEVGNHGSGSFVAPADGHAGSTLLRVPVVAGDEVLLPASSGTVTVVKIDVEGYERPVLEGLRRVLQTHRPVLVVEISPGSAESVASEAALRAALPERYGLACLTDPIGRESGHYALTPALPFDTPSHFELVAYPEELAERIPRHNSEKNPYELMRAYRVHERHAELHPDAGGRTRR